MTKQQQQRDIITAAMARTGLTRLQVLLRMKEVVTSPRHAATVAAHPNSARSMEILDAMIAEEEAK